jgi:hypothetical protein
MKPTWALALAGCLIALDAEAQSFGVHVDSVSVLEAAPAAWQRVLGTAGGLLDDVPAAAINVGIINGITVYRIVAGPFADQGEALDRCAVLTPRGQYCRVMLVPKTATPVADALTDAGELIGPSITAPLDPGTPARPVTDAEAIAAMSFRDAGPPPGAARTSPTANVGQLATPPMPNPDMPAPIPVERPTVAANDMVMDDSAALAAMTDHAAVAPRLPRDQFLRSTAPEGEATPSLLGRWSTRAGRCDMPDVIITDSDVIRRGTDDTFVSMHCSITQTGEMVELACADGGVAALMVGAHRAALLRVQGPDGRWVDGGGAIWQRCGLVDE